ncbi:MAG: hypothetical protein K1X51_06660 [Rhodospirillaceae bacterium]|nr:hypothetical protein [Rhodospirillaceae bacterium]
MNPWELCAEDLRRHYRAAAVIFYGSCLRDRTADGLLDFYVLVDRYSDAMGNAAALGAWLLPPNVYSHVLGTARAKVAVMRVDEFLSDLGANRFTTTLSARFAQPCAIVHARDNALRARLEAGFVTAANTCIQRTLPLMPPQFTALDLWRRVLSESFAAELRPERPERIRSLVDGTAAFYAAATERVLGAPSDGVYRIVPRRGARAGATLAWCLRRILGKTLNALRLIKAAFTFQGGIDYAAWKIGRHTGIMLPVTDDDRKKPLRAGLRLFARSLRLNAIR